MTLSITLIGGPTALIEIDGFRLLTDPTFDGPGAYQLPHVKLEKLTGPALKPDAIGEIDAVLFSHDQHSDNLDHSGKDFLKEAKRVLTTEAGAKRLGGHAEGFAPWASTELKGKDGRTLVITATPARRPGRHRAAIRRCHRLCRRLEQRGQPPDLCQRRYQLV
jgi:L-ascorbate metabolism protein UlaG (beta-lactamase superfamily)